MSDTHAKRNTIGFAGEIQHTTGFLLLEAEEVRDYNFGYVADPDNAVFSNGEKCGPTQSYINTYLYNNIVSGNTSLSDLIGNKDAETGIAPLTNGKVPSDYLPSYVDDVVAGTMSSDGKTFSYKYDANPDSTTVYQIQTGESGKIYVDTNTNKTYRWGGSAGWVVIASDLALGETSSTAFRGDKGLYAYNHAINSGEIGKIESGLYKIGTDKYGHVTSHTNVEASDISSMVKSIMSDQYATDKTAGVVKVGSGLSITNGVLNATGDVTASTIEWGTTKNNEGVWNAMSTYISSTGVMKKADEATHATSADSATNAGTASQVAHSLSFASGAFTSVSPFNGSADISVKIPTSTSDISEGTSLYYTEDRVRKVIGDTVNANYVNNLGISQFTLEAATNDKLGGVIIDQNTLTITDAGLLSVPIDKLLKSSSYLGANYYDMSTVDDKINKSGIFDSTQYYTKNDCDTTFLKSENIPVKNVYVNGTTVIDNNGIAQISLTDYVTNSSLASLLSSSSYLTSSSMSNYVTNDSLTSTLSGYATKSDLNNVNIDVDDALSNTSTNPVQNKAIYSYLGANYYTKDEVTSKIADSGTFVASDYYTKTNIDNTLASYVKSSQVENSLSTTSTNPISNSAVATAINEINNKVSALPSSSNVTTSISNALENATYTSHIIFNTSGEGNAVSSIQFKYDDGADGMTYTFSVTKTNIEASSSGGDVASITVNNDDSTSGDFVTGISAIGHTLTLTKGSVDLSNYATKEYVNSQGMTVDSELSDSSTNPVQNKVIYDTLGNYYTRNDTNTQISNKLESYYTKDEINGMSYATTSQLDKIKITVDSKLDSTSSNPVKNSVVTDALASKANSSDVTSAINSAVKNLTSNSDVITIVHNALETVSYVSHIKITTSGEGNAVSGVSLNASDGTDGTTYTLTITKTNIEASSSGGDIASVTVVPQTSGKFVTGATGSGHTITLSGSDVAISDVSGLESRLTTISNSVPTIYNLEFQDDGTTFNTFDPDKANSTLNFISGTYMNVVGSGNNLTISTYATNDSALATSEVESICKDILGV